jgi:3,4-dihydroxy 2-butanone 4-phosphate synthase / GTP cyclohydrolase II
MCENVEKAIVELASGGMIVVADNPDRENEADLVVAATTMTTEHMAFFLRWGSGIVYTPMSAHRADQLQLPPMTGTNHLAAAFTVSVDHIATGTGISATDRVLTVRALASPATRPTELRRPGHVFPLRTTESSVLERPGRTAAAIELIGLAGLGDVAVTTELVDDTGNPLTGNKPAEFAHRHSLPILQIADLAPYRRTHTPTLERGSSARLPLPQGTFQATGYTSTDGTDHLALTLGDIRTSAAHPHGTLVHLHRECLTGDAFGAQRCACGPRLDQALRMIADEGTGIVIYLRGHHEHRIIDSTPDPRHHTIGIHDYSTAAAILADLRVQRLHLLTDDPEQSRYLNEHGFDPIKRIEATLDQFVC